VCLLPVTALTCCSLFTVLLVGFSSTNYTVSEGEVSVDVEIFQFLPSFSVEFVVRVYTAGIESRKRVLNLVY